MVDVQALRAKAKALVDKCGLRQAADKLGLGQDTLARFVAGANSHKATVQVVRMGLKGKRA